MPARRSLLVADVNIHGVIYTWERDGDPDTPTTTYHWFRLRTPGTETLLRAEDPSMLNSWWRWATYSIPHGPEPLARGRADDKTIALIQASKALKIIPENRILWRGDAL